jgi:hypothetical protein
LILRAARGRSTRQPASLGGHGEICGPLTLVEREDMAFDSGFVAPRGRAGERRSGTKGSNIGDRRVHEIEEHLEGHTNGGCDPLGLTQYCHEMIRGHHRGRVIRGAILVGDPNRTASEGINDRTNSRIAGYGEPCASKSLGSGGSVGHRDQRMKRRGPRVIGQNGKAQRTGEMSNYSLGRDGK